MFRECYFEYAGQSSQPYDLMLCYVSNSNTDFDSGGKFDLKTDTLPRSHETLLYGKDYSAQPLEFDVEFMNIHGAIPFEQMIKIKNWLFGQDGWKTFKCLDDRQDYHLKCMFEPGEDIVDGIGYRGLRCKLRNVSPFWYGEERALTITRSQLDSAQSVTIGDFTYAALDLNVDVNDGTVPHDISPIIEVFIDSSTDATKYNLDTRIMVSRVDCLSISDALSLNGAGSGFNLAADGAVAILVDGYTSLSSAHDTIRVSSQYGYIYPDNYNSPGVAWQVGDAPYQQGNSELFFLKSGTNIIRLIDDSRIARIRFRYTPQYRLGAF